MRFVLTYFKRYEIAACAIAVAIPLVVVFIWSTIEGRAMGFTAAGAGVSVVLLLAGLFVFTRVFARAAQAKLEKLVSLYNDDCDVAAFLEGSSKIAESAEPPLGELPAWFLSFYACALINVDRKREAAKFGLMIQDSVKDAPTDEAKIALYADLVPLVKSLFDNYRVIALIDEALSLPNLGDDIITQQRRAFLSWSREVAQAELAHDESKLIGLYRSVWGNHDQCTRLRVVYAAKEGELHAAAGNRDAAAGCMRFAADNGKDLLAARTARAFFGE